MLVNRRLNSPDSEKDTRHFEISLDGSGLSYEVGDSMAVYPTNCPALVDEILAALGAKGDEEIPGKDGTTTTVREALAARLQHHPADAEILARHRGARFRRSAPATNCSIRNGNRISTPISGAWR